MRSVTYPFSRTPNLLKRIQHIKAHPQQHIPLLALHPTQHARRSTMCLVLPDTQERQTLQHNSSLWAIRHDWCEDTAYAVNVIVAISVERRRGC